MNTEANEPASPILSLHDASSFYLGLTKREYFAAMAMQAILISADRGKTFEQCANDSVIASDALIDALNK